MTAHSIADSTRGGYKPSKLYSLCGTPEVEEPQIRPVLVKLTHGNYDSNCMDFI